MKKSILLLSLVIIGLSGFSQKQNKTNRTTPSNENNSTAAVTATSSANLTAAPSYPGGSDAFLKYIRKNIKYPATARNNKTQGRVIVRFKVDADGNVKDAKVPEGMGIGDGCDEEAIRVVMLSSKWTPGMRLGTPSAMWYEVPITFAFNEVK